MAGDRQRLQEQSACRAEAAEEIKGKFLQLLSAEGWLAFPLSPSKAAQRVKTRVSLQA